MTALTRHPYETLLNEADAIAQHARAAAGYAVTRVDQSAAYPFVVIAQRADEAVRQMKLRMRELDKASEGEHDDHHS